MPELPEVETMVRDLGPRVLGRTIVDVDPVFPGEIVYPSADDLRSRAIDRRIEGISRRGKYAIFRLDSGDVLSIHRGMSGTLLWRCQGDPMESHVRFRLLLDGSAELRLD